ncbi:MAG: gamma-glutamyl-gamma-aminobutyrate hydrolase family protein [Gemmatimonadaceae bacterium]|nr:gamma-glutamyl-gamma-aminobutyrate hydrolase family protein [Gemmatimonadaceae bacterium]NUQ94480.1 gamma-glutamyl-gamma-aminobutyrate hydrolase family protein [Gemmatimonadaceae bacterium]NUS97750.1 gamma-glutamyl-gamma-aminobutyrate hydrolase family protein [Gemmatimonadaceae bacterium]
MPRPPLVALSATTELLRGRPRIRLNEAYTDAIAGAAMLPLVVPPLDTARADEIVAAVDGIVLTGGEDVDPARYGAARHPATEGLHGARDGWEIALLAAARAARRPVLAICRGIQVANVALGGTLVQDLPSERPSAIAHARSDDREERVHDVDVTPGSRLAAALGATHLRVNSSHHQALDRVAPGLAVTAAAPDGVVEGAEWTGDDGWWMLGVQWHPEELVRTAEGWDRALFAAFRAALLEGSLVGR